MSIVYKCDNCKLESCSEFDIELKGIPRSKGILLPASLQKYIFCSKKCFWAWIENYIVE